MISIIVPIKNETESIQAKLASLKMRKPPAEIIVVKSDGGSFQTDHAVVCRSEGRGRGAAIDTGARIAHGEILLFLHADTDLPENAFREIEVAMTIPGVVGGWFRRRLNDPRWRFRVVDFGANAFSYFSSIGTGDQAIFCRRSAWTEFGGCNSYPLFEDMHMCRSLKKIGKSVTITTPVLASPRRFYQNGVIRTVCTNLRLTVKYFAGCDPQRLFDEYYGASQV